MRIDNRFFDSYTAEFNSPLTDEDWEKLEDIDFDHTEHIWFHTKNGKEVHFYKNAISIEWLMKKADEWATKDITYDGKPCMFTAQQVGLAIALMVNEWEKENETEAR